ncbi:MAG: D-alanyl-D-alanine carboxypeptidase/D-alanyl-D-alanine endopeptidase [Azovibrio sp.]
MFRFLSGICFVFWCSVLSAQSLPSFVAQALKSAQIPESAVGVVVQPVEGGFRVQHNTGFAMNPASVMKLVTTYGILESLGAATTWKTEVWSELTPDVDGRLRGNLYIKGSGDPKLTMDQFEAMLRQLRVRGIRSIEGDVVLDRGVFNIPGEDPGAFDGKPMRAYNVGPDGLLVDFRALRFTVFPEGEEVRLLSETPSDGLVVKHSLRLDKKGVCDGWRDQLQVRYIPGLNGGVLEIGGDYPGVCGESTLFLAPLTADQQVAGLFRALWKELGGTLKGSVRGGVTPPTAIRLLLSHDSPPLAEMVRDVNKFSNNVMARQLFLALAQAPGETDLEVKAASRMKAWLSSKGLDFPELVMENGSGLSRKERISADSLNRLLVSAWKSPVMPDFMASLPITGQDGTMKKRLKNTPAEGRSRIKTGSLEGVRTAAGYALDAQGRWYTVVFLINHPKAGAGQGAIDALLLWIAQSGKEEKAGP